MKRHHSLRDERVWDKPQALAFTYADEFELPLDSISFLPPKKTFYGDCSGDGHIRISLRRPDGSALPAYMLLDILAHELAHLRTLEHDGEWMLLFTEILSAMVRHGQLETLEKVCAGRKK